jgi:hypothetical protein
MPTIAKKTLKNRDFIISGQGREPCGLRVLRFAMRNTVTLDREYRVAMRHVGLAAREANWHLDVKRIIKGRPLGVGFDRSHHHLQQGAPL